MKKDRKSESAGILRQKIEEQITMRMQAEEALRESERFLREVQLIANLGAYSLDIPSFKWKSSEVLNHIFGFDADLSISIEEWISIVHPGWQKMMTDYLLKEVIENKTNFNKEYKIIRKNDRAERWVHGLGILKFDNNNQPLTLVGTMQDITDRKLSEEELVRAKEKAGERDHLKSSFIANISDEILSTLNGILGFTGLLKEQLLTGEEQREYIGIIEESGISILHILNDIITISKVESGQVKTFISPTNVNEQIEFVYNFFKPEVEQKGLQIIFEKFLSEKDAVITTDKEKLNAILTNLIRNAIKFSNNGTIEIGYRLCDGDKTCLVSTSAQLEDEGLSFTPTELEFFVKDCGVGIPKDRIDAIFDRFLQGNKGDKNAFHKMGLGLPISKAFVEILGGKIWVDSEVGKGSSFYFTIPYTRVQEVENVNKTDGIEVSKLKNIKILIAEDDEISEMLIEMAIKTFGRNVLKTSNGIETVEVCRNNPDLDFVLMDIKMPEMDGYEATRQIRKFNNNVIIIAQTAYALSGDRERALEAGCNDYIAKPFGKESLTALMKKVLTGKEVRGNAI